MSMDGSKPLLTIVEYLNSTSIIVPQLKYLQDALFLVQFT